jgi:recombination protein RecR
MALKLARDPEGLLQELVSALRQTGETVRCCPLCGSLSADGAEPCHMCVDSSRDASVVCVVEDPNDIIMIEKSGGFNGRYHALMGKVSPMRGDGPADLRIRALLKRMEKEKFREVILALNTDVESDATAGFLAELLKKKNVKITRLAFGLPAGSGIMYSDSVTLCRAISGRRSVDAGR